MLSGTKRRMRGAAEVKNGGKNVEVGARVGGGGNDEKTAGAAEEEERR